LSIQKNTLWNLLGSAAPMLLGIVTIPFLLRALGTERLGVLTLIWALIGYFSIFDFGLGRALTYKVSSLKAIDHGGRVWQSIKSGLSLLMTVGLFGAALVTALVGIVGVHWLNVSAGLYEETKSAVLIAGIAIPVTTLTSGLRGILEGLENFKVVNLLKSLLGVSNFLVPVAAVAAFGPSLTIIVSGLLIARFIVMILHILVLNENFQYFRSKHLSDERNWRDLAVFGAWMTISNVLSPLMVVSDRFFISHFIGTSAVVFYTVPNDFLFRLLILPAALTTTLFPVFAQKLRLEDFGIRKLYLKALLSIAALMLPITLGIALFAHFWLNLWLGREFADRSHLVVVLLAIGIFFNSLAQIPHAMIQASGDARRTSLVHVVELVFYIPLLIFSVLQFGIVGAAIAWQARMIADFFILNTYARRVFRQFRAQ
jgi:O-antigen/teichoic acid export membrane protein